MTCPICKNPSAPNARPEDPRCGPCHNFGLVGMGKYGQMTVQMSFPDWLARVEADLMRADNMETYACWLESLRKAYLDRQ